MPPLHSDRAARIEGIVAAHLRDVLAGRSGGEDALIAAHPDLLPEIEVELRKVRLFGEACALADQSTASQSGDTLSPLGSQDSSLHVRCPDCWATRTFGPR